MRCLIEMPGCRGTHKELDTTSDIPVSKSFGRNGGADVPLDRIVAQFDSPVF